MIPALLSTPDHWSRPRQPCNSRVQMSSPASEAAVSRGALYSFCEDRGAFLVTPRPRRLQAQRAPLTTGLQRTEFFSRRALFALATAGSHFDACCLLNKPGPAYLGDASCRKTLLTNASSTFQKLDSPTKSKEVLPAPLARRWPQAVLTKQREHYDQRHQWRPVGAPSAEQIERRISDPLFGAGGGFPLRA